MNSPSRGNESRFLVWVIALAVVGLFVFTLLPPISSARGPARRSQCKNNLKQIGLALHNYHDTYGSFPPAIVYGPEGKPWHSWRTLLLPFLEAQTLHVRYRFDEPWNGPNNRKLAEEKLPWPVFLCPSDADAPSGTTSYLAVIGENTMWPPDGAASLSDATDGTDRTLHVVEVSNSGVHWMEPVDLRLDAMTFTISPGHQPGIRGRHGGTDRWLAEDDPWVANVERVDGSVTALDSTTSPETVRSMLIRNDGVPLTP